MLPDNNQESEPGERSEQQDRFGLIAALLVVAFVIFGLWLPRGSESDSEARIYFADKSGDRQAYSYLSRLVGGQEAMQTVSQNAAQNAIAEYSKGLPDTGLEIKIAAVKALAAQDNTAKVKLGAAVPDRELWQTILSSKSLSKSLLQPALKLVARSNLGPLEDPLISVVYSKSGDRENAEKAMQRARSAARSVLNTALITGSIVFFLVVLGTVLLTIGIRQIRNLPPITGDQMFPNIRSFVRYLAVYILISTLFRHPQMKPLAASLTLPVVLLIAQLIAFVQLDLRTLYKRLHIRGSLLKAFGYGVAGSIAALPLLFLFSAVSKHLFPEAPRLDPITPILAGGGIKAMVLILIITIVGPFVEEVAFRGVLLDSLLKRMRFWPAAFFSSAIFSALHGNLSFRFMPLFVFALILCYLRRRTGSLFSSYIAHAANNILVTALFFLS